MVIVIMRHLVREPNLPDLVLVHLHAIPRMALWQLLLGLAGLSERLSSLSIVHSDSPTVQVEVSKAVSTAMHWISEVLKVVSEHSLRSQKSL